MAIKPKFPYEPLRDRVIIRLDPEVEKHGTLYVPTGSVEMKNFTGTVVAVGTGIVTDAGSVIPLHVKPGDRVRYSSYAGDALVHDDERYIIVSEANILAIARTPSDVSPSRT